MRYKTQMQVSVELIRKSNIDDEYFYREMARKIVSEIPVEELSKIFKVKITNPFLVKYDYPSLTKAEFDLMNDLRNRGLILYEAEVIL